MQNKRKNKFLKWAGQIGGGGGVIAFLIYHYTVSNERGWLEDEAGCSGIVWFTQEAISQWFIDQLVLRGQRGRGEWWVFEFGCIRLLKGLEEECLG